jgi:hypothetical protein
MLAPAADRGIDSAASASSPATSGRGGPNINPSTGLSTDYLNHFTEAVMVLEMVGTMPECLDDLRAWQAKTYAEHFATSHFSNRNTIIAAYQSADPAVRMALDRTSDVLNAMLWRTRELVLQHVGTAEVEKVARRALDRVRPLIARTAALINGTALKTAERQGPQAAVDAIFGR